MCSCLDSVTKTSAYGVDLASPPLLLRNRPSGPSMRRNVPENAKRVQHVLGPERRPTGSPNVYVKCSYGKADDGGDGRIRTVDTSFCPYAPLAGERRRPLGHVSATCKPPQNTRRPQ